MNRLSSDFSLVKYGMNVRLVDETDADFIVKLRTSPKVSQFLHYTEKNVEVQRRWINEYKDREEKGLEYYFIFLVDGERKGLYRLYNIHGNIFTGGSWLFEDNAPMEFSIGALLIGLDIAFDVLNLNLCDLYDGVHEDNKKVLWFNKLIGVEFSELKETPSGRFHIGKLTKESYKSRRNKVEKMIGL